MNAPIIPTLALALAAAAKARLRLSQRVEALAQAFVEAVGVTDAADRRYRESIERVLSPLQAQRVLWPMADFRREVALARERARGKLQELYAANGATYGAFDPLDTFVPAPVGLSHVDATRAAGIADQARAQVDGLRTAVNTSVLGALDGPQVTALLEAKRERVREFGAAIESVLRFALTEPLTEIEVQRAVAHLRHLADGWY